MTNAKFVFTAFAIAYAAFGLNAKSPLRVDFSYGIPNEFATEDLDGAQISTDVRNLGFDDGDAWIGYYIQEENEYVAASTSWYTSSVRASDWLITPSVKIETGAVARWRAKAMDKSFRDGYQVYIAEKGVQANDFLSNTPVFSTDAENALWENHEVDLSEWIGKEISLAFVNNSIDCSVLFIDDIMIGVPQRAALSNTTPPIYKAEEKLVLKASAFTDLDEGINGFSVNLNIGQKVITAKFPDVRLQRGEKYNFEIPTDIILKDGEEYSYSLSTDSDVLESVIRGASVKTIAEEFTGSWCSWCVQGIVAFRELREMYPDTFFGIALHYNDFLQPESYTDFVWDIANVSGLPYCIANRYRSLTGAPINLKEFHESLTQRQLEGEVRLSVEKNADNWRAHTEAVSLMEGTDSRYKIAYAIVENDVYEPNDHRYKQHNQYADGKNGEMGGFENLPEWILDFHFDDVARGCIGEPGGIADSLPPTVRKGVPYVHNIDFSLPNNVLDEKNVTLVAMLVDSLDGRIINADWETLDPSGTNHLEMPETVIMSCGPKYYDILGNQISEAPEHGIYIEWNGNKAYKKLGIPKP